MHVQLIAATCGTRVPPLMQALCQDNLVTSDTNCYSNEHVVPAPLGEVNQAQSAVTPAVLNQDRGGSINTASPARSLRQVSGAPWQAKGSACSPLLLQSSTAFHLYQKRSRGAGLMPMCLHYCCSFSILCSKLSGVQG